jgi:hypothetical protein
MCIALTLLQSTKVVILELHIYLLKKRKQEYNQNPLMTLNALTKQKLEQYTNHCLIALNFYYTQDHEHALINFRKSGEAFMKIIVLKKYEESDGEKIYNGILDTDLNTIAGVQKQLEYSELMQILWDKKLCPGDVNQRLRDLQTKTNPSAHNPNSQTFFEDGAELCKSQSRELSTYLFNTLGIDFPKELASAYQGQINAAKIASLQSSPLDALLSMVDSFSNHQKYLLVAPPKFDQNALEHIGTLSRINWSFVLDFDPHSKEDGLYKTVEGLKANSFIPLTIKQKGLKNIVGAGTNMNINWLFANGLQSIQDTQAKNIRAWLTMRYSHFIKDLFREYFTKEVSRYTIIYLWDDLDFVEEIVRAIKDIEQLPSDLITHIFITNDSNKTDRIRSFDKYDIVYDVFELSHIQFLSELKNSLPAISTDHSGILVPARTKLEENTFAEISDINQKLLDDYITVVHQHIERTEESLTSYTIPPFYQGELITWKDLAINLEAERNKYEELQNKITGHLNTSKKSIKFELYHKPGAGGTTLALRAGFNLKRSYPVILISKYNNARTFAALKLFLSKVNRPTLAIVESSMISLNDLENLIRNCNADKLIVCFLYIRRTISAITPSDFSLFLNDTILDLNERDRFIAKANTYTPNKEVIKTLEQKAPKETEVIDFPLAINEKEYNNAKVIDYIKPYLDKLPEEQVRFCAFVSMIYYYTQKPVSELVFRSLFENTLSHTLRKTPASKQFIRKLLIQEYDIRTNTYKEYWRPRFSKFAEAILKVVVGASNPNNWKDHIDSYALEFLKRFKENNVYLVNETQDLLKALFFERNNEDLLGTAEQWNSVTNNEQFSFLLRDISNKQKQKSLLEAIVNAYPDENHYLGHLGRFLYEKAEEESEFIDAESYIQQALSIQNGEEDYNLQHLGGMCYRRRLEFLKRKQRSPHHEEISLDTLIEFGNSANAYFDASRSLNPYNAHAYVAQIQTLLLTIDLATAISGAENKYQFITAGSNRWFLIQLNTVRSLIDQAFVVVEQQETLGKTSRTEKAKYYLQSGEGQYYEALGNYNTSVSHFQQMIDTVDRDFRPAMRRMFIHATLLRRAKGNPQHIESAWDKLKEEEIRLIEKAISDDILQDGSNVFVLRNWFKLVRYSSIDISLDEVIARLQMWYDSSNDQSILNLEAAFYLYVVHAIITLRSESISQHHKNEANKYIQKCLELSKNTRHTYEYLGKGEGLDALINHQSRSLTDDRYLSRLEGTISVISSRQTGRITLPCALEAFFVPYPGGFIQGTDETSPVTFLLGFRHDGLFAFDVKRQGDEAVVEEMQTNSTTKVSEEFLEEVKEPEQVEELKVETKDEERNAKLPGLKIISKIDLSKVPKK